MNVDIVIFAASYEHISIGKLNATDSISLGSVDSYTPIFIQVKYFQKAIIISTTY
jgi:hypothetical protein